MLATSEPFGRRVRGFRLQHALTQLELAERAGVSRSTILLAERGRRPPRPGTVRKIAQALGITPMQLTLHEKASTAYATPVEAAQITR